MMGKSSPWRYLCHYQQLRDTCKSLSALEVWLSKEFYKWMERFYYFVIILFFFLYKIRIAVPSLLPGPVSNKHLRF